MSSAFLYEDRLRREDLDPPSVEEKSMYFLAVMATAVALLGVNNLVPGSGFTHNATVILIAGTAGCVSAATNMFALRHAAFHAAAGRHFAFVVALVAQLMVGSALWLSSTAGVLLPSTAHLRDVEHGTALTGVVSDVHRKSDRMVALIGSLDGIKNKLDGIVGCEIAGRCAWAGLAGDGPITKVAREWAAVASGLKAKFAEGVNLYRVEGDQVQELLNSYRKQLDAGGDALAARSDLQAIDGEIKRKISELENSLPMAAVAAFISQLDGGVKIAGRQLAESGFNAILKDCAAQLRAAMSSMTGKLAVYPTFPSLTGVDDVLLYLGHFLPIVMLIFSIELVLPISVFIYTFYSRSHDFYLLEGPRKEPRATAIDPLRPLRYHDRRRAWEEAEEVDPIAFPPPPRPKRLEAPPARPLKADERRGKTEISDDDV
jgi:hypothetical protein